MSTRRRLTRGGVALLACLTVTSACGGGGGGGKSLTAAPSSSATSDSTSTPPSTGGGSSYDIPLPVKIRVVNGYAVGGVGQPVDVWVGTPQSGAKLATVAYGEVSEPLIPLRNGFRGPETVDGQEVYSYSLSVYTVGGTEEAQNVTTQGATAFDGDEAFLTLGPGLAVPQSFAPAAGLGSLIFSKAGNPKVNASMFAQAVAPAGKGLLVITGTGVLAGDSASRFVFDVGQPGVGCLPQIPNGSTDVVVDEHSRVLSGAGGGVAVVYVVPPGPQKVYLYGGTDTGCKAKPVAGPFETEPNGDRSAFMLYGPPSDLKSLTLPL